MQNVDKCTTKCRWSVHYQRGCDQMIVGFTTN